MNSTMKTTSVLPFQRRDLRRLLVVIAACIGSALGLPPFVSGAPPKTGSRPNLVVIMSDDKDESAGPKAENLR
jgi:hypothetical protein